MPRRMSQALNGLMTPPKSRRTFEVEMIDISPGADHGARHRVTVPAQVLGRSVDDDRNTQLEGLLEDR